MTLTALAQQLGLRPRGRGAWGPCPVCGAEVRGREDRRGPLSIHAGDTAWRCHAGACDAGGDDVALVAAVRHGACRLPPGDPRWPEILAEAGRAPLAGPVAGVGGHRPPSGARAPGRPQERPPAPPPDYLPRDQVEALWAACRPLGGLADDHPTHRYLRSRGLTPTALAALDLVRVLPGLDPWPSWVPARARGGRYPLVVAMHDAAGRLRSVRFRAAEPAVQPKTLATGPIVGLVMADPIALALLRGERQADGMAWDGTVVVCEGEPDWWTWSAHPARGPRALQTGQTWATVGIVAGAWSAEIARRIPDRARVVVRTHHDPAGHQYAAEIRASLSPRCTVLRSPPPSPDEASHGH